MYIKMGIKDIRTLFPVSLIEMGYKGQLKYASLQKKGKEKFDI